MPASSLLDALVKAIAESLPTGVAICVAYSGGRDSTALLHAAATVLSARGYDISALHVHHGLSPNADAWARHCQRTCDALRVPLAIIPVRVARDGQGIEAAARDARYQALARSNAAAVLLAHHQDDQAETVIVQLLRGAGVSGLAAMAPVFHRQGMRFVRPWLAHARSDIARYAVDRQLAWIDDESNHDSRFTRNYLRAEVMPALARHNPAASQTLSRSASHLAQSAELLADLATLDFEQTLTADGALVLARVAALSGARQANLFRHWLKRYGHAMPSQAWLTQALRQLLNATADAQIDLTLAHASVKRYRGDAYLVAHAPRQWHAPVAWTDESCVMLPPSGGSVQFAESAEAGLRPPRLGERWEFRKRVGGERLRLAANRHSRSLKHLYQELSVPPWLREQAPILVCDGQIAWAAGIGVDAAFSCVTGRRYAVAWQTSISEPV